MQGRKTRCRGVVMVVIVSPPKLWVWFPLMTRFTRYTICQWLLAGREFSSGTSVSSTNTTYLHDIKVKLLKVVLNTINIALTQNLKYVQRILLNKEIKIDMKISQKIIYHIT